MVCDIYAEHAFPRAQHTQVGDGEPSLVMHHYW